MARARIWHVLTAAGSGVVLTLALAACGGGDPADAMDRASTPTGTPPGALTAMRALASSEAPLAPAATGVLASDDFESGMAKWSDWGNAQVVDGAGASGSLRAMRVGTAAGGAGYAVAGVVPGESYRLTAQVRVSDPSEIVYVGVSVLNASGEQIARQQVSVSGISYSPATVEVLAPAGAVSALVFVWKNADGGHAYVDDVQLATAASSPPPPPDTANLLSNPGFEAGMAGWVNWSNALVVDGAGVSGSRALRVGTAAGGAGQDVAGIVPGARYQLSAQVRVSDASEVAYIGVNIVDASGSMVAQQVEAFTSTTDSAAVVQVTAPAGAAKALVFVWKNAGGGHAYIDEVQLVRAGATPPPPPPDPANLLSNPGFEAGMASWVNWGNALVVDGAGVADSHALRVGAGAGGAGQEVGSIVAGAQYQLAAGVRVSDASELAYIGVKILDPSGSTLAEELVPFSNTWLASSSLPGASVQVTAPAGAARALVFVWKNAGSGYAYLDEFVFSRNDEGTQPPSPNNLVVNPGFEDGLAGWSTFGFATPTVVNDAASGEHAARFESPWAGMAGLLQVIQVVPGQTYTLSAQGKVSVVSGFANSHLHVGLKFIESPEEAAMCQPEGCPDPASYLAFSHLIYQSGKIDVVAPPNTQWAIVIVGQPDGIALGYADNISLVPAPTPDNPWGY